MNRLATYHADLMMALSQIDRPALERLALALQGVKGTVYVLGNGGSQSNASHLVLHLIMSKIPAVDLASQIAMFTAFSNDYAFAAASLHALRNMSKEGDALFVISGSGDSPDILVALAEARELNLKTFGLLGFGGGAAHWMCDHCLCLAMKGYGPIEDCHLVIIHMLQELLRHTV